MCQSLVVGLLAVVEYLSVFEDSDALSVLEETYFEASGGEYGDADEGVGGFVDYGY